MTLCVLTGCSSLLPRPQAPPTLFVLEDATATSAVASSSHSIVAARSTLVVEESRAAPGYDSRGIVYVQARNRLDYFAFNQWVDPPAVMLAPLLVQAIERTHAFRAVVRAPTTVVGDVRLETELVRLLHDFTVAPSRVRLTMRALLVDTATHRVVASREFNAELPAPSEDAAGGVAAATRVVHLVLADVGAFCAEWAVDRK